MNNSNISNIYFFTLFVTYKLKYVNLVCIAQLFHGKQRYLSQKINILTLINIIEQILRILKTTFIFNKIEICNNSWVRFRMGI